MLVDGFEDVTLSVGVDVPDLLDFFLTAICRWTEATAPTDLVFLDPIAARAFFTIFDALADRPPRDFKDPFFLLLLPFGETLSTGVLRGLFCGL